MTIEAMKQALLQSDPDLSKFSPLDRILFYDDFSNGFHGWGQLLGNHNGNLDEICNLPDSIAPQLSNCSYFDIGTHGVMTGNYALKVSTRPIPHDMNAAIKRVTAQGRGKVQFETYFSFKAEQTFDQRDVEEWDGNRDKSQLDFGDFTISNDVAEDTTGKRYHCALRYINADTEGNLIQRWFYKTSVHVTTKLKLLGYESEDFHVLDPKDWEEVPGGHQPMCYNEVPTKVNWHYLRWVFDTVKRRNIELQVNNLTMDLRELPVPEYDHDYHAINNILNFLVDVRSNKPVRNFFLMDSALVSVDW